MLEGSISMDGEGGFQVIKLWKGARNSYLQYTTCQPKSDYEEKLWKRPEKSSEELMGAECILKTKAQLWLDIYFKDSRWGNDRSGVLLPVECGWDGDPDAKNDPWGSVISRPCLGQESWARTLTQTSGQDRWWQRRWHSVLPACAPFLQGPSGGERHGLFVCCINGCPLQMGVLYSRFWLHMSKLVNLNLYFPHAWNTQMYSACHLDLLSES